LFGCHSVQRLTVLVLAACIVFDIFLLLLLSDVLVVAP
jgi:hypothetical protein